ncbi:MAG TPA: alpha/beta fold hydrolase [Vicinamibacterales bacterium]|nr:alpha/beta fold hydrolase [Vicinamibacterales bacterium]
MSRSAAPLVLIAAWLAAAPAWAGPPQDVQFRTADSVSIAGTLYLPARPGPAPAVILLHMQTRSRLDWERVGPRLAEAGFVALAIDFRGHGASDPRPAGENARDGGMTEDVRAARGFLATRREVIPGRVGILGASVGANLAVLAAAADPTVRSLALLSPGLDYKGLRTQSPLNRYGDRPAILVGSREDNYVMISMRRLSGEGTGTREQLVLDGAGHGTTMLQRNPDLIGVLVDWFRRTLL